VRRPTINLSQWKLSVDIEETRAIQNQAGLPAYQCKCKDCESWRSYYEKNIPEDFINSLRRIGVDLDNPSDCYGPKNSLRVIFHFVGIIQEGPGSKIYDETLDQNIMNYVPIRNEPWLSLMVLPVRDSFEQGPKNRMARMKKLFVLI